MVWPVPSVNSGWFVESLATQTLVIFAIRTRKTPFFRSRPSVPLTLSASAVVLVGAVLPATPVAGALGFQPLPGPFFAALVGMVILYLGLIEWGKRLFYGASATRVPARVVHSESRHLRRRVAHLSHSVPRSG